MQHYARYNFYVRFSKEKALRQNLRLPDERV